MGENNTYRASASHANTVGNINYWLSYTREESDGYRMSSDFKPEIATRQRGWMPNVDGIHENGGFRSNSDYVRDRLWARAGLDTDNGSEYYLSVHYLNSSYGIPPATDKYRIFTRSGDDPAFSNLARFDKYDDWGADLSIKEMVSDDVTVRAKLFYHNHEDVYLSYDSPNYDHVISRSSYKDDLFGTSIITDFSFFDMHDGHVSVHYRFDSHNDRGDTYLPFNQYQSFTGSIGTEHAFYFGGGLSLYAGVAYDWLDIDNAQEYVFDTNDLFVGQRDLVVPGTKDAINPLIGVIWDLEALKMKTYASVAKKTQFPTLSKLYSSTSGNPDLDEETTINYTVGVEKWFGDRVSASLNGFYHDISDWISRDYYPSSWPYDEIYVNVEDVTMMGLEAGLKVTFCDYFRMNFNYMYNKAENESDDAATDKVIGVPKQKLGVGCNILVPVVLVSVDVQGIYVGEMYDSLPTTQDATDPESKTDSYFTFNTRISKTIQDKYEIFGEVNNVLDENVIEEVGYPGPGRNISLGMRVDF